MFNLKSVKKIIKSLMRSFGIEVSRYDLQATQFGRFVAALQAFEINLVLDVGANEGQFGESLRESGYIGEIVSFEPLKASPRSEANPQDAPGCCRLLAGCALTMLRTKRKM
jgi:hypothetical protein